MPNCDPGRRTDATPTAVDQRRYDFAPAHPAPVPDTRLLFPETENGDFKGFGDREADLLARRDLDRLTGLRVPPHAGLGLYLTECAQPGNLHRIALLHRP